MNEHRQDALLIRLTVNGQHHQLAVAPEMTLKELLREELNLTGTKSGCDAGDCGACTVLMDGRAVTSCLVLAANADGAEVTTIEGIGNPDDLHPMQAAFRECHALQCGFCTPGMIMSAIDLVQSSDDLDRSAVREGLEGNLCRCTGYHNIVEAVLRAAPQMK